MVNILIVDDDKKIRDVIERILKNEFNCYIRVANNAKNGLDIFNNKGADIVFFDYLYMGGADGINLLFDMRRKDPKCILVMMSGFLQTMDDVKEKGLGITPHEFLHKPFQKSDLIRIITTYFDSLKYEKPKKTD